MTKTRLIITFIFSLICINKSFSSSIKSGFFDFNYYYDDRDFNVYTINTLANIDNKVQYFSFVNYSNNINSDQNLETTDFFSEQNLRYALLDYSLPLDLTAQWVLQSNSKNDAFRLGVRLKVSSIKWIQSFFKSISTMYSLNFHMINIDHLDGYQWQMEHVYFIMVFPKTFKKRVHLVGFLDQNFNSTGNTVVTEHQLAVRLINNLHFVTEWRYNGFLAKQKSGVGVGLQYKVLFTK